MTTPMPTWAAHWTLYRFQREHAYNYANPEGSLRAFDAPPLLTGLYVDSETNEKNRDTAQVVELALVPFKYDANGIVYSSGHAGAWLEEPTAPMTVEAFEAHGITPEALAGQRIDDDKATAMVDAADVVIAHHAAFDRPILERRLPAFASKRWGCSYTGVPWRTVYGATCSKLGHLLIELRGEFYKAHRAELDCRVGIHLLTTQDPDGRTALSHVLRAVELPTYRVWSYGAPFSLKDQQKARGYYWHGGNNRHPKAWYFDCDTMEALQAELEWLRGKWVDPYVEQFDALNRFSVRTAP